MKKRLTLYPKTKRLGQSVVVVTEKLDGSNLGIFKQGEHLLIAQRNWVFKWSREGTELDKTNSYKGIISWLNENGNYLLDNLIDGSGLFGEWIGMGHIKYDLDGKFYAFAKARTDGNSIEHLTYDIRSLGYVFENEELPNFIKTVPIVAVYNNYPKKELLDDLYDEYIDEKNDDNKVEGFIIIDKDVVTKYVRLKGGKLKEHLPPREQTKG